MKIIPVRREQKKAVETPAAPPAPEAKAEPETVAPAAEPAQPKRPLDCPDPACGKTINHGGPHG